MSCNASKGAKLLKTWLESKYCKDKIITKDTVALVVKKAIRNEPKLKLKSFVKYLVDFYTPN